MCATHKIMKDMTTMHVPVLLLSFSNEALLTKYFANYAYSRHVIFLRNKVNYDIRKHGCKVEEREANEKAK